MTKRDLSGMSGEDRLIADYFRPLAKASGAMALRDDAAFFTPPAGCDLVLTKDALVAGVHFFADDPPDTIAQKALRVNLSDLAAKGAEPAGFLLALALPGSVDAAWLKAFSDGLAQDAEKYGCALYGGDTVKTPGPLMVSVTAFGTLPHGTMVHRAGAGVGDTVVVCGPIGDAALGLELRRDAERAKTWELDAAAASYLVERYRVPSPQVDLAEAVRTFAAASMDVSDGLVGDLAKLCRESGVSADIEAARIPLSDAAAAAIAREPSLLAAALTGGDDYVILCTVPADKSEAFMQACTGARAIGRIVAGTVPPRFLDRERRPLAFERGSFSHF